MSMSNMPAHNSGQGGVPKGTRHGATSVHGGTSEGKTPKQGGSKPNMPAHNSGKASVTLGHTKHGVGQVPSYLKGRDN